MSSPAAVISLAPAMAWRRPPAHVEGLSKAQRRVVVAAIGLLHIGALWAVLQIPVVRAAVIDAAPTVFVDLLAPPAPAAPPSPPPPPVVQPAPKPALLTVPAAVPSPVQFEAEPVRELPPPEQPVQQAAIEAPAVPAAPPPVPPKMIPASAVQYLEAPPPEYPRASKRLGEAGTVLLRVYIDERGLPAEVQVHKSSGFARLDEAALNGMKKWRFKPYMENGQPTAGWARIPLLFEVEK